MKSSRREDKKIQNRVAQEENKSEIELGLRVLRVDLRIFLTLLCFKNDTVQTSVNNKRKFDDKNS